jgi:predicted phosphohydrolase
MEDVCRLAAFHWPCDGSLVWPRKWEHMTEQVRRARAGSIQLCSTSALAKCSTRFLVHVDYPPILTATSFHDISLSLCTDARLRRVILKFNPLFR